MRKIVSLAVLSILCIVAPYCQTPTTLNSPIAYDSDLNMFGNQSEYENVIGIRTAFNNARRREELQFCLPTNSIPNLQMPSQATWNNMNTDERFLYLANAERMSRSGLDYCQGDGPVKGIPFTGVEANIDNIAQTHAEYLISIQSRDAESQAENIDANPNIGGSGCTTDKLTMPNCCHSFLPWSVYRISFTSMETPSNPNTITTTGIGARSVYYCVYGNGAIGNGRRMLLMQDVEQGGNTADPCGFTDDYGDIGDEGFLGVGVAGGVPNPTTTTATHIDMVILSYFDPVPQSNGCNYNCTSCTSCPVNRNLNSNQIASGNYQASNSIKSATTVASNRTVNMQAGSFLQLNSSFEVKSGAIFSAIIDGCYFSLN